MERIQFNELPEAFLRRKEHNNNPYLCSSFRNKCVVRISTDEVSHETRGSFPDRNCLLVDSLDKTLSKICSKKDELVRSKDVYQVVVQEGINGAKVCGVVAVLDHIHGESTSC